MLKLILISCCIHVFLLIAVFNTFFRSIIESDLPSIRTTKNPPAKRILLIIVDGLGAEAILDENEYLAPFLTSIRRGVGSWGVSYGDAPTESRIGHTAVIGGFREDPRAILNAWGHYPVKYDTVFEHSSNTWCIAVTPTVAYIFNKYKNENVRVYAYNDTCQVWNDDVWSINKFRSILNDESFQEDFSKPGNIFAVLLPRVDWVAHHEYGKYSEEISVVDARIKNITERFQEMFPDNETTYMVTSDHGARIGGGHGTDTPEEITSPFICWGAGVYRDINRKDLKNIDIAPLISVLLGINFPTNSRGIVPVNYLDISDQQKYQVVLKNLHQIFNIYEKKECTLSRKTLIKKQYLNVSEFRNVLMELHNPNSTNGEVSEIVDLSKIVLEAMDYTQLYYTYNIIFSGLLGLLFWILYLFSLMEEEFSEGKIEYIKTRTFQLLLVFYVSSISLIIFSDIFFFLYYSFPLGCFYLLMSNYKKFLSFFSTSYACPSKVSIVWFCCIYISIIFGFRKREYFSWTFLLLSPVLYILPEGISHSAKTWKHTWAIFCAIISYFPSITSYDTEEDVTMLIATGGILWHLFSLYAFIEIIIIKKDIHFTTFQYSITLAQTICSFLALLVRLYKPSITDTTFTLIVFINLFSFALIPFSMKTTEVRILTIFLGVVPSFITTSFPRDTLVFTLFSMLLITYSIVETNTTSDTKHLRYMRVCLVVIGLNLFCLIGIINLSYMGHPLPSWIRWSNYLQKEEWLLYQIYVVKLWIPLILTACVFRYIILKTGIKLKTCFLLIEIFFSTMIFQIILRVRNTGSWLDMGMSLVNFFIVNFFALFLVAFYIVARLLMTFKFPETLKEKVESLEIIVY
ncbi:GPI ethanolamine phosphate transferase 1-like [Coccinella septempunctata]|uniref:GPI ethanolamine phosphate transferase 1-like n=1 Tax=Coccinella septempunctata TaxID=41139 RepID=UPI001D07CB68|nr:GPI ethanolamine phosphate transferase 1-like [Coccinella septempunctata]